MRRLPIAGSTLVPTEGLRRRGGRRAAAEVAQRLGADPAGLVHLPAGSTSWVFDLPSAGVVLIVARPSRSPADVLARAGAARELSRSLPFVAPREDPIRTSDGLWVTPWERVPVRQGRPDPVALGAAVRGLQDVDPSVVRAQGIALADLQQVDSILDTLTRLTGSGVVGPRDARLLVACAARLGDELAALPGADDRGPDRVLVHGDLHLDNVLATADGCVLCDTDELATGGPDWDLAFLVDPGRRGVLAGDERRGFEEGYGAALPDEATARTLARIAHLRRTVLQLGVLRPTSRERWWNRVRLGSWAAVAADWTLDEHPAFQLTPTAQLRRILMRRQPADRGVRVPGDQPAA